MSRISVTISLKSPQRIVAEMQPAIRAGIFRATIWWARKIRQMYGTSGGGPFERKVSARSGRVYWTGPASPVGGYPAVRSGRLRDTTNELPIKGTTGGVGASARYARYVHIRRPFLSLSARQFQRQIKAQFEQGFRRALSKGAG